MTGDVNERTSLSTYRFVAALCAGLLVGGFTLPLVAKFGHGNSAKGWQMTMGLWAIVCVVFFFITFATVRERIQPDPRQKSSARRDFRDLLKNGPWIAMFLFTLVHLMAVAMRGGTMAYYFKYNVDQERLFVFLKSWRLTAPADGSNPGGVWHYLLNTFGLIIDPGRTNISQVGFSLLNMSSQFVTILGIMCATWLAIRFGKKAVVITGFAATMGLMALLLIVPTNAIWTIFVLDWARAICYAPTIPLVWAMFADVVDYSEWTTGRRATGVIYAAIVFGLKAGLSLGGAIAGWLLSAFGYQPNVTQTNHALWGIRMIVSVIPAGLFLVCVICVVCYKIPKKLNLQIQDELAERRKQYAAVSTGKLPLVAD
jgi:Na+/melibiose symporter-like transporter